jgi:predicted SnoaL-like aldol condensation-catalyzing enzyme
MTSTTTAEVNKALVSKVMTAVFIRRDFGSVAKYFSPNYKQHNPAIPNGPDSIPLVLKALPPTFRYEPGMIAAEGDLVMIHGRYTGWAEKPLVAVDIFRVVDGTLVEHWDVMQEEVPASATKSSNPMF